jgi:hypothetical protein
MAWIKVTDLQGHPVWLSVEQMVRIRPCVAGIDFLAPDTKTSDTKTPAHDHKNSDVSPALALAKSIVDLVSGVQAARETQDEILERIRKARKDDDNDKTADARNA